MEQNHNREQSEKGSDNNLRLGLGAVAAIYILYLGVKLLKSFADGTGGAPAWVDIVFGLLFIACGAGYMIWEVVRYLLTPNRNFGSHKRYQIRWRALSGGARKSP